MGTRYGVTFCPACRTSLIATRFWVVVICPIIKCLTVLEFSFILFDLCLFITIFNFILNYVPIVTFWIFTYHIARPKGVPPKAARPQDGLFRLHASWISPMQDLTVWPPSCVISENSRSLAAIFFSDGNTRHCSRVYISRDLIWIKIVVGKTIYKQIVIILAIRFAVLSTVFQWK